jgi:hypothetical protein
MLTTVDYHTAGEPFRIVTGGAPEPAGATVLDRRESAIHGELDAVRELLCSEPRGHADMYGGFLVPPDDDGAHLGVLFWHKDGFSTACGHGTIALATYAVDEGIVEAPRDGEVEVVIDVPSGRVRAVVRRVEGQVESVRFATAVLRAGAGAVEGRADDSRPVVRRRGLRTSTPPPWGWSITSTWRAHPGGARDQVGPRRPRGARSASDRLSGSTAPSGTSASGRRRPVHQRNSPCSPTASTVHRAAGTSAARAARRPELPTADPRARASSRFLPAASSAVGRQPRRGAHRGRGLAPHREHRFVPTRATPSGAGSSSMSLEVGTPRARPLETPGARSTRCAISGRPAAEQRRCARAWGPPPALLLMPDESARTWA